MSRQAITAGRAFVDLILNDKKFLKPLRNASQKLKDMGSGMMGVGQIAVGAGAALGAAFIYPIKAASDLEETMNKFNVVFGENAGQVKAWGDNFAGEVGRSKKQIADFMANTADLLIPLGFEPGAATDFSKQITGLSLDLASFNNMQDADVLRDLHAALTGSGEVMKKYGVIVSQAAVNQELLNMGMDPKTATEQQKVQARMNIIMAGTTAAQGDAIRSAGGFANTLKRLQGIADDVSASIGSALLPTITKYANMAAKAAEVAGKFIEQNQEMVQIIAMVAGGLIAAGAAIFGVGALVSTAGVALSGFVTILTTIGSAIAFILSPIGLISAALAAGVTYWALYTKSGQDAVSSLVDGFDWLYGKAKEVFGGISDALAAGDLMLAGEIAMAGLQVIFLKGLDALSSIFGEAFGKISSQLLEGDFSAAWETLVLNLAAVWDGFVEGITAVFTNASRAILSTWQKTVNAISNQLLEMSSEGGLLGSVATQIIGYDIAEQQRERDRLNKALGLGPENVLDQSKGFAAEFTGGTADSISSYLDGLDRNAQARTRESDAAANTANAGGANPALMAAEKNLADLVARSAAARAAKEEAQAKAEENKQSTSGANTLNVPNVAEAGKSVFSTFSAAAFQAAGGLRSDPKKEEKETVEQLKETKAYIMRMAKAQEKGIVIGGY